MFVDELTIYAEAGNGGDGVERWLRERHRPLGGPAGGDGGKGGDVYIRGVRDMNILGKYVGVEGFSAERGGHGGSRSRHGRDGEHCIIDLPVGSVVTNIKTKDESRLTKEGEKICILKGGDGGYGNEHFKSAENRTPVETTKGKKGEKGTFWIELELSADVGLIGFPNAGKSTLLNALTSAHSRIGAYPFTTLEPHLGDLYGFIIADIPGLIEGASEGKGLGHKFLRHVRRTRMVLHCVSLEESAVEEQYEKIRNELGQFDDALLQKPEWVVLTKSDKREPEDAELKFFEDKNIKVFVTSTERAETLKKLRDALTLALREGI